MTHASPSTSDIPRPTFRWFMRDGLPPTRVATKARKTTQVRVIVVAKAAPAAAQRRSSVRVADDELQSRPTLTGPAEAYWPADSHKVRTVGADLVIFETSSPSGEERQVKSYPASRFAAETVAGNIVVRRRELTASDRDARAAEMKRQRLANEAKIEGMNARSRQRWGRK